MPEENLLRISGLVNDSIVDGPGMRFTIFTQGCPHHCPGCHNPQTHDFEGGTLITAEELLKKLRRNPLLSGVALSGGEPFCQAAFFPPFLDAVHKMGLNVFAYSGYTFEELFARSQSDSATREMLARCDVLVDGPFLLAERDLTLRFRGSRNQRVLDVARSLSEGRAVSAVLPD